MNKKGELKMRKNYRMVHMVTYNVLALIIIYLVLANQRLNDLAIQEYDRGYNKAAMFYQDWKYGFHQGWEAGIEYMEDCYGNK